MATDFPTLLCSANCFETAKVALEEEPDAGAYDRMCMTGAWLSAKDEKDVKLVFRQVSLANFCCSVWIIMVLLS